MGLIVENCIKRVLKQGCIYLGKYRHEEEKVLPHKSVRPVRVT